MAAKVKGKEKKAKPKPPIKTVKVPAEAQVQIHLVEKQAQTPEPQTETQENQQPKQQATQPKQASRFQKNKVFLILAAVVLIFAFVAFPNFFPEPANAGLDDFTPLTDQNNGPELGPPLNFIIIYDERCPDCEENPSLLDLFTRNTINYEGVKYEASGELAQAFITELGLKKLPAMIVDGNTIYDKMIVKSDSKLLIKTPTGEAPLREFLISLSRRYEDATFNEKNNIFVFPELNLDAGNHTEYIIDGNACSPEKEHQFARADIFFDPYDIIYISALPALNVNQVRIYSDNIDFRYHAMRSEFITLLPDDASKEDAEAFSKFTLCAQEQNAKIVVEDALYSYYCSLDGDGELTQAERDQCYTSENFNVPITEDKAWELVRAAEVELDEEKFSQCLSTVSDKIEDGKNLAQELYISRIPSVVFNCKYVTHPSTFESGLCKANPNLPRCA